MNMFGTDTRITHAHRIQKIGRILMGICAGFSLVVSFGVLFSMMYESFIFFSRYPVFDFIFGTHWSPQFEGIGTDSSKGAFGVLPLLVGTLVIVGVALAVAIPFGVFSAIYFAEFASPRFRRISKPILEILAGIPTVVYGFFAILVIAPLVRSFGESVGVDVASESALTAGIVMGFMIIPFVSSLVDDAMQAVPNALREASYGLGATRAETVIRVVFPSALPGIVGAFILAFSRAIGETMIVVMAAGLMAKISFNPLDSLTTITVQIVTVLTGDQAFDSLKTLSAFALGVYLFAITLVLNMWALYIVRKYSEKYE